MPPTVSEQAFANRFNWYGNGQAGSNYNNTNSNPKFTTCGSSNNNYLSSESLNNLLNQSGGNKRKQSNRKSNSKKKLNHKKIANNKSVSKTNIKN